MKNKVIFTLISMTLLLSIVANCCMVTFAVDIDSLSSNVDIDDLMEQEFADDRVIVILKHADSLKFNDYSPATFSEIECEEVFNLSTDIESKIQCAINNIVTAVCSQESPIISADWDFSGFNSIMSLKLTTPGKENVVKAINALKKRNDVLYCGPDYLLTMNNEATINNTDSETTSYTSVSTINSLLGLTGAWDAASFTYSKRIRVAVIDSGIDRQHPLLKLYMETSGLSADYSDFYTNPSSVADSNDHSDSTGHGTHVAGIIASAVDESFWEGSYINHIELVSIKVFDGGDRAHLSELIAAINYASSINAKIINFSGGGEIDSYGFDIATLLYETIEQYQGLFICAAGNDNQDIDTLNVYPAVLNLDNVITVGASTSNDQRWSSSNYGSTNVDLFAPGESILSTFYVNLCNINTCETINNGKFAGTHVDIDINGDGTIDNGYHAVSGSSMAAPFVTGVAALLLAIDETMSPTQLKNVILNSVDKVTSLEEYCVTGGRLNAYKAVMNIECSHTNVTYSRTTSQYYHNLTCSDCDCTFIESHSWIQQSTALYRCTLCGMLSDQDVILNLPPENEDLTE